MPDNKQDFKRPTIRINYNNLDQKKGQFISVPRFWIDEFFGSCTYYPDITTTKGRPMRGERIPSSFWRYTLYLWRHVSVGRQHRGHGPFTYYTTISMDQFPVRGEAAVQWTAAYAVSGVMSVDMGAWAPDHKDSTLFTYNPETQDEPWRCFLQALALACIQWQKLRTAARHDKRGSVSWPVGPNAGGWKVLIAREVDKQRTNIVGWEPVNTDFLQGAASGNIVDAWGRPIAKRDKDGVIQPILYPAQRRRRPGEDEDDWERRVMYEMDDRKTREEHGGF